MNKIGEKVKALRKELKMTQSELAGDEMTKSMLSQIENNVSSPSMKTLQYIAHRLNKPVAYFLEESNSEEMGFAAPNLFTNEIEEKLKGINDLINEGKFDKAQGKIDLLKNDSISGTAGKVYADILYKLGNKLIDKDEYDNGKKYIKSSIEFYSAGKFYIDAARAFMELGRCLFKEFRYEDCLELSKPAFDIYSRAINRDISFEIELYHSQIMVLTALGRVEEALEALEKALKLSAESNIYYKSDELYRVTAVIHYLRGNKEEYNNCVKKALQFAEFSEDKLSLSNAYLLMSVEATDSGDPESALKYIELHQKYLGNTIYFYYLQKSKAYYLLDKYDLAYENIKKVDYPSYVRHKLDYLLMWTSKIYEGLILSKLGKLEQAVKEISAGIDKMNFFGDSRFLADGYKALSEVYSEMKDYEKAFAALKKSSEIRELLLKEKRDVY